MNGAAPNIIGRLREKAAGARTAFVADYRRRGELLRGRGIFGYMRGNRGYVLVIVLLVTAMLVSISTEFLITAQTNINYIRKFSDRNKAHSIARTGIELAKFILEADKRGMATGILLQRADKNIDCFQDLWALEFPEIPLEDGGVKVAISDENGKINLSVLANEFTDRTPYYAITQRFFMNLGLPMDLADSIIDWVDIDDARFPYGAETSDYYMSLEQPYRARNKELDSLDELLLVKGVTPQYFYGLGGGNLGKEENLVDDNMGKRKLNTLLLSEMTPEKAKQVAEEFDKDTSNLEMKIGKEKSRRFSDYFRAYGNRGDYLNELNRININTAPYRVLAALTDYMTDDVVTEIIRRRNVNPFKSVSEVKDLIQDDTVISNIISVKSYIFRIESTGRTGSSTVTITGYYARDEKRFLYWSEE